MFYSVSYQTYNYERGLSAAEQRAADVRVGETAAALGLLRLRLGPAMRWKHDARAAGAAGRTLAGSGSAARVQPSVR
jgi:hypothetical protein